MGAADRLSSAPQPAHEYFTTFQGVSVLSRRREPSVGAANSDSIAVLFLTLFCFVALMAGSIYLSIAATHRRQARAMAWADANGFTYLQSEPGLAEYCDNLPFAPRGGNRASAMDVVHGVTPSGRPICSFMYVYVVSTGKSSTTVRIAVTVVRLPVMVPWLTVTKEGLGDKIAEMFGGQDIELESDDFNRQFRVRSASEALAYGVLHPRMMEWLLGPAHDLVPFSIYDANLYCWRYGEPDYDTIGAQLTAMETLVAQIPQQVWRQFGQLSAPFWSPTGLVD